jgi:hypothetical protein
MHTVNWIPNTKIGLLVAISLIYFSVITIERQSVFRLTKRKQRKSISLASERHKDVFNGFRTAVAEELLPVEYFLWMRLKFLKFYGCRVDLTRRCIDGHPALAPNSMLIDRLDFKLP